MNRARDAGGLLTESTRQLDEASVALHMACQLLRDERSGLEAERDRLTGTRTLLEEDRRRLAEERLVGERLVGERLPRDLAAGGPGQLQATLQAQQAEIAALRAAASPFVHYNTSFDPQEVIRRHAVAGIEPTPGLVTNFLGVRVDPVVFPPALDPMAGTVEAIPIPANWHADIAEWGAALRAVDLARDSFTAIELGCGWGCWLNNTGAAARREGLDVRLIGVEGDHGHVGFAAATLADNGFVPGQWSLHHGVAAATAGIALFPRQSQAGSTWGLEPVFGATEVQRQAARASRTFDELPMVAMADLVAQPARVDLLHVDIQGGEADLVAGSIGPLCEKVAYMVIGTHSRQIEGALFDTLLTHGWTLEIERPAIFHRLAGAPVVSVDGVQGWRNPRLLP